MSNSADEEVDPTSCNAMGPAGVVEACGLLEVSRKNWDIVEIGKPFAKPLEVSLRAHSRKDFLPDLANEARSPVADLVSPLSGGNAY